MFFGYRQVSGEGEIAVEVDHLFQEIDSGWIAEFYRSQSADELKRATSEKEFVAFSESINEHLGKLQSQTVSGFTFGTNHVDAAYEGQFERGKATVKARFVREQGRLPLHPFSRTARRSLTFRPASLLNHPR